MEYDVVLLTDVYHDGFIRAAGAYRIATILRNAGAKVQVIDFAARLTEQELRAVLDTYISSKTKLVGISNTFLNVKFNLGLFPNNYTLEVLNEYKNKNNFKLIIGGNRNSYTSIKQNDYLNCLDLIVVGFADAAIIEIYNNLDKTYINNVFFADDYPYNFENADIVWNESDHIFQNEVLPIEIARGCVFRCSYCFFPLNGKGNHSKYLKSENIIKQEIINNYIKYGVDTYDIMDDLLNDSVQKIEMIHRIFTSLPFKVKYTAYARPDLIIVHPHTLKLLEESGCVALRFGIETFNPQSAKAIGKGMSADKIISGLHWMRENSDINLGGSFIAGLPFETKESLDWMLDWLLQKSNPLHQRQIGVLSIPRINGRIDTSKLMIDPNKYGYTDLDPSQQDYMDWDNGHMTRQYCFNKLKPVWDELNKSSTYNSHDAFRMLNLGYSMDYILNTPISKFVDIEERTNKLKTKYLSQLLIK